MSVQNPGRAKSWEEIQPLAELCWAGRLYDVQRWIESRKPIDPPEDMRLTKRRRAPLAVAIETGFHSMVELLVRAGADLDTSWGTALPLAIRHNRPDIAHLLLDLGEDVNDASFGDVLTHKWDRTLVDRFIALGADTVTDNPIALAFRHGMRPALGVYMDYKEKFPQWKEQLGIALVYHIREGSPRWIALLKWAGADPHLPVQREPWHERHDFKQSPLELAIGLGRVDLVRKFGIHPARDDMESLLRNAIVSLNTEMIKSVLGQTGQPLNNHPWGTRVISDFCEHCEFSRRWLYTPKISENEAATRITEMLSWGLKWQSADRRQKRDVREFLYHISSRAVVQIVTAMVKHKTMAMSELRDIMNTDKMHAHLRVHLSELQFLWGRGEREEERARLYCNRQDRRRRERMRKDDLKQAAREEEMLHGPDAKIIARISKTLDRRGPLAISRLAKLCGNIEIPVIRRILFRMRAAGKVDLNGAGHGARWEIPKSGAFNFTVGIGSFARR